MWKNPKNEALLKREQQNPEATFYPQGKLMISAGPPIPLTDEMGLMLEFLLTKVATSQFNRFELLKRIRKLPLYNFHRKP